MPGMKPDMTRSGGGGGPISLLMKVLYTRESSQPLPAGAGIILAGARHGEEVVRYAVVHIAEA